MATTSLPSSNEVRRSSAAGLLTGILLLAVVVLSRRMVGAITGFSSASAACLVAGFVMLVGLASGLSLKRDQDTSTTQHSLLLATLSALPGLAMGLALLPTQDAGGLVALLGEFGILVVSGMNLAPIIVTRTQLQGGESTPTRESLLVGASGLVGAEPDGTARSNERVPDPLGTECTRPMVTTHVERVVATNGADVKPSDLIEVDVSEMSEANDIRLDEHSLNRTQWMQRSLCDGCDVIEGSVRVTLSRGVKQVAVHVPFAPAFVAAPQFEAEPLGEADVEVRQTSLHCYGVRFEVARRQHLHEVVSVEISYFASAALFESAAA